MRYLYDGSWRVIEERDDDEFRARSRPATSTARSTLTSWSACTATRTGDGDLPTNENFYYLQDRLFNVVALTDTDGAVQERVCYEPYGRSTCRRVSDGDETVGSHFGNPYLFTGRELDSETCFYNYRGRYYSPALGRFLNEDPLASDVNLYAYCSNDPTNATDPNGTMRVVPGPTSGQQTQGRVPCGKEVKASWDFFLTTPVRPGGKRLGAPCKGWIVQFVSVITSIDPCTASGAMVEDVLGGHFQRFWYWEAWPVNKGQIQSSVRKGVQTDTADFKPPDNTYGYYQQAGTIKFYCDKAADDPSHQQTIDAGDLSGWHPGSRIRRNQVFYGTGQAATTPGILPSTGDEPAFWESPPADGPASRYFSVNWNCCNVRAKGVSRCGNVITIEHDDW